MWWFALADASLTPAAHRHDVTRRWLSNQGTGGLIMKKLHIALAITLGTLALGVLALGLVLQNQANFSKNYVHDQLIEKQIYFTPVAGLMPNQQQVPCLVANAGKQLLTGKQAECYARYQIGLDLLVIDNGKTYAEDHYAAYLLRLKAQDAVAKNPDAPETAELVKQSQALSQKAEDIFDGETMRGLLLTVYGFSLIGERGGQAAVACFAIAGALVLGACIAVVVGARRRRRPQSPRDAQQHVAADETEHAEVRDLVGVG
jgi:hypothetical protein